MSQTTRTRPTVLILFAVALLATALLIFAFIRARPQEDTLLDRPEPFEGWRLPTTETAPPFSLTAITLADSPYRHPSGAFSVRYPQGWQIDETEDAALFTAPDDSASFSVNFMAADPTAGNGLAAWAEADLQAGWGDLPGFTLQSASASFANYWSAGFTYDQPAAPDHPAMPMTGLGIVQLREGVIFRQTYLARTDLVNNVANAFQAIYESLVIDSHAAISNSE